MRVLTMTWPELGQCGPVDVLVDNDNKISTLTKFLIVLPLNSFADKASMSSFDIFVVDSMPEPAILRNLLQIASLPA